MTTSDTPDRHPLPGTFDPASLWLPDAATLAYWDCVRPGQAITIVKQNTDGMEAARYPGTVLAGDTSESWRTIVATWTMKDVSEGGLTFATGDTLHERFSPHHPFNAFAVTSPNGTFKGWYANVTWPTLLWQEGDEVILAWRDLILDIVVLPDGTVTCLDDDEFEQARNRFASAQFAAGVRAIRDRLIDLARTGAPPFHALPNGS